MRKPVHGVLLNAFDHTIGEHTLSGTLGSYYEALNCNCFDMVRQAFRSRELQSDRFWRIQIVTCIS